MTDGLLTDAAIASYKRRPLLAFEQRETVVAGWAGVRTSCAKRHSTSSRTCRRLRPRWFVHGDDWRTGVLQDVRQTVERTLAEWGGELVEPPYTQGISSSALAARLGERRIEPRVRQESLTRRSGHLLRAVGAWDAGSGEIAEKSRADAVWVAPRPALGDTGLRSEQWVGCEAFAAGELLQGLQPLLCATSRPILVDALAATTPAHVSWLVRALDGLGVSALFLEGSREALLAAKQLAQRTILVGATIPPGASATLERALALEVDALYLRAPTEAKDTETAVRHLRVRAARRDDTPLDRTRPV